MKYRHEVTFALLWHFNSFWCRDKSHAIPRYYLHGSWIFIPSPQDRNKYQYSQHHEEQQHSDSHPHLVIALLAFQEIHKRKGNQGKDTGNFDDSWENLQRQRKWNIKYSLFFFVNHAMTTMTTKKRKAFDDPVRRFRSHLNFFFQM